MMLYELISPSQKTFECTVHMNTLCAMALSLVRYKAAIGLNMCSANSQTRLYYEEIRLIQGQKVRGG